MRILTIDLEDWFQVYNFNKEIEYSQWSNQETRVVNSTKRLLNILDRYRTKATFFVLGWIADQYPELVNEIHERGHEIACHGYSHKPLFNSNKHEFARDLERALSAIENACGVKCEGYRAPSFSITEDTLWALDVLKEKGIKYDSSMFPVKRPDYGIKCRKEPFMTEQRIMEIPMTVIWKIPIGGGYFRILPYFITRLLLKQNENAIFYIHPWEIDSKQPRIKISLWRKFRQYFGLRSCEKKFRKLLGEFEFERIKDVIEY